MRKRKEKKKIGIYIVGGFVVFLMIFSVLSLYNPSEQQQKVEYNEHMFYRTNNGWFTRIAGEQVSFFYLPGELENLSINAAIDLNAEKAYFVSESDTINTKYPADRVKSTFYYFTNLRVVDACLTKEDKGGETIIDEDCPETYPLVGCEDAEAQVFYFREANLTGVAEGGARAYSDGKCVVIEAEGNTEMERITERLIYKIHGIMG